MEVHGQALKEGTILDGRYRVDAVLGEGGFGITYKAHDIKLDYDVAIKEFLPVESAARGSDSDSVLARTNRVDDYKYGLQRFLDEAKTLVKIQHPNVVHVNNYIEENGTAYMIMNYVAGEDLASWLKSNALSLNEEKILEVIIPIVEGLEAIHEQGLLHRDIKPGNIYIKESGGALLIDFGSARQKLNTQSKSMSAIVSLGYAPPEQYSSRGNQGAWTDLYAIGAVLYKMVTGNEPVESVERSHEIHEGEPDPLIPAVYGARGKFDNWLLQLIDQLLQISIKKRPQSARDVLIAFKNKTTVEEFSPGNINTSNSQTRIVKNEERFTVTENNQKNELLRENHLREFFSRHKFLPLFSIVLLVSGVSSVLFKYYLPEVKINKPEVKEIIRPIEKGESVLFINTDPQGAEVYFDSRLVGKSPFVGSELKEGKYTLVLSHPDYEDITTDIQLEKHIVTKKEFKLEKAKGNYSVLSKPARAKIYLDGKDTKQYTPATLFDLKIGEHSIRLEKDKYYPLEINVQVNKDQTEKKLFVLKGGNLVKINGEWMEEKEAAIIKEVQQEEKAKEKLKRKMLLNAQSEKVRKNEKIIGKMIQIPDGQYFMGSKEDIGLETPRHKVRIKPFYLGQHEVTKGQFSLFVKETAYITDAEKNADGYKGCFIKKKGTFSFGYVEGSNWKKPGFTQKNNEPVVCVSWRDTTAYIEWAIKKTGLSLRLPSESEWEYAARAGSEDKYVFGNDSTGLCEHGNVADNMIRKAFKLWTVSKCNDHALYTAKIMRYKPNQFGLYDMHGNVYERVEDCWNKSYKKAPNDGSVWEDGDCDKTVMRGASWFSSPYKLRLSYRGSANVTDRSSISGFRLAHDI